VFDLINGLPLHPLVVHAVVVLLPLAALGTIAIAVRPGWRRTYGWLVVGITVVAAVFLPIATSSGEALEERVGSPGEHAEMGDALIWFTLPMLVIVAALVWFDRRPTPKVDGRLLKALPVLAVVAALACSVQVYRVGDSGARAAWGNRVGSSSSASADSDGG
jgi:uncharacterized membrane protein